MDIKAHETVVIPAGCLDVVSNRLMAPGVTVHLDGDVDIRFAMSPEEARDFAAQLIAAADHAEGKA